MSTSSDTELDAETQLAAAAEFKLKGNAKMKEEHYVEAIEAYEAGLKRIRGTSAADDLLISLSLNLALACVKTERYFEGVRAATTVIEKQPDNLKALYRRGLCRCRLSFWPEAREDLMAVIRLDPNNADARRELQLLKERQKASAKEEKQSMAGLFDRMSCQGLYDDREEERKRKEKEQAEKTAKLRRIYDEECNDKDKVTFETWKEQREKSEQEEAKRKAAQKISPVRASPAKKDDEELLDEEDKKIIAETAKRGYCYFRKELTEEEKALKAANVPQKLQESPSPPSPATKKGVSDWNAAGSTYEEKDTSKWCQQNLMKRLQEQLQAYESPAATLTLEDMAQNIPQFTEVLAKINDDQKFLDNAANLVPIKISLEQDPEIKAEGQVMVVRGTVRRMYEITQLTVKAKLESRPLSDGIWTGRSMTVANKEDISNAASKESLRNVPISIQIEREAATGDFGRLVSQFATAKVQDLVNKAFALFEEDYEKAF